MEGVPAYVEKVVQKRQSFIYIPDGIMIPISIDDHFQTYDLKDNRGTSGPSLPMIRPAQARRLESRAARFGGLLKEFTLEGKPKKKGVYFEPVYYTRLESSPQK